MTDSLTVNFVKRRIFMSPTTTARFREHYTLPPDEVIVEDPSLPDGSWWIQGIQDDEDARSTERALPHISPSFHPPTVGMGTNRRERRAAAAVERRRR